ncbi:MAG: hypothetical protein WCV81_01865 [Microgenomates group bacterium]|jgi:surface carbohydrate biosynthesis protein
MLKEMMDKCDILIVMFFFKGRDAEIIIPLKYYLENIFHLNVKVCSVFDPYMIDIYNPGIVLMENTIGSEFHVAFGKYAFKKGYPIVSLVSEGYLTEQNVQTDLWGCNLKHEIYFNKWFLWTPGLKRMALKYFPDLKKKVDLDISGAIGFDRYQIYDFADQRKFLKKYHKEKYKKVIGYAGWVFCSYFNPKEYEKLISEFGQKYFSYFKNDKETVSNILRQIIKSNKDTLFIFKLHPSEMEDNMDISRSWAQEFDNVLVFQAEEPVADIINVCDIWMVYDSTTCTEAWLLGKPTIVIMPSPNIKFRSDCYKGSAIARNLHQLSDLIDNYKEKERVEGFYEKKKYRKKIIRALVYREDGLNFKRTAEKIHQFLMISSKRRDTSLLSFKICYLIQHLSLVLLSRLIWLPFLNKSTILKWYNEQPDFINLEKKYTPYIRKFLKTS